MSEQTFAVPVMSAFTVTMTNLVAGTDKHTGKPVVTAWLTWPSTTPDGFTFTMRVHVDITQVTVHPHSDSVGKGVPGWCATVGVTDGPFVMFKSTVANLDELFTAISNVDVNSGVNTWAGFYEIVRALAVVRQTLIDKMRYTVVVAELIGDTEV